MSYQGVRQVADELHIEMPHLADENLALRLLPQKATDTSHYAPPKSFMRKVLKFAFTAALLGITGTIFYKILSAQSFLVPVNKPATSDTILFDNRGRYVMRDYDQMKPNANFLSGLGGLWGMPMVSVSSRAIHQFIFAHIDT